MKKRRVVITGLGVVAPNGIGIEEFWKANIEGKSGIDKIKSFDTSKHEIKIAGEVKNFQPLNYMPSGIANRTDRFAQLGIAAAKEAIQDSKLNLTIEDTSKIGVCLGSGLGGAPFHEEQIVSIIKQGFNQANPLCVPKVTPNSVSAYISIIFNLKGPNMVISTACSSGGHGLGVACDLIKLNRADVMVSGGVEAPITPFTLAAYTALSVLSSRNDLPQKASRPFDRNRDGFVISEGAGILILEELEHARKRGANIYAEIVGYGATSGAHHMVLPVKTGEDAQEAMNIAIKEANIEIGQIDYINAHGTATQMNDIAETLAIKGLFKKHAYKIPISSTKSMIGHTIGAAGAIEVIVCALAIKDSMIPPTINYETKDPDCDLDYVPNKARKKEINFALSNSFGFGNSNAVILIKKLFSK